MSDATSQSRIYPANAAGSTPEIVTVKKRTVFAWSLWDWGSASFNAVVTTFVFAVYLTSESFGPEAVTSARLGTALLIAGIVVALLAPVIGKLTDAAGRRKTWLGINTVVVVAATALLVLVAPAEHYLLLGLVLLAIGNVAFEFASVSYNSMLRQISTNANVGKVSGFGWGMGYLGGIVLLAIILVGFIFPDVGWFGVTSEDGWNVRVAMIIATRTFQPSSEVTPNQPTSGKMNPTRMIASSTIPPRYPMPQPKPDTLPTFAFVEICRSIEL